MEFRILGSLSVTDGARSVELRRAKSRTALAVLLPPQPVVSCDRLVEALWGKPTAKRGETLQGYVSHLRRARSLSRLETEMLAQHPSLDWVPPAAVHAVPIGVPAGAATSAPFPSSTGVRMAHSGQIGVSHSTQVSRVASSGGGRT